MIHRHRRELVNDETPDVQNAVQRYPLMVIPSTWDLMHLAVEAVAEDGSMGQVYRLVTVEQATVICAKPTASKDYEC